MRLLRRKIRTISTARKLLNIQSPEISKKAVMPLLVHTPGGVIMDRDTIRKEAEAFGRGRFTDPFNATGTQSIRLHRLWSAGRNEIMDGRPCSARALFQLLQSRATLSEGKAAGVDSMPPEVFRRLPFVACLFD